MRDILIQTRNTIAPTCNWWSGGNARLLESFQLFKINEPRKFRCFALIRKYKSFQSSNTTWAILWSKLATPLLQPVTERVVEMQTGF